MCCHTHEFMEFVELFLRVSSTPSTSGKPKLHKLQELTDASIIHSELKDVSILYFELTKLPNSFPYFFPFLFCLLAFFLPFPFLALVCPSIIV